MKESNKKIISTFIRKTSLVTFILMTIGIFSNISIVAFADTTKWTTIKSENLPSEVMYTDIAIDSSGTLYVVYTYEWTHNHETGSKIMKYENGSWTTIASMAGPASMARSPSGTPYVAYYSGTGKITVMKYEKGSWIPVDSAGFSPGFADDINIAIDSSGTPYVVYRDTINSNKATVMKYESGSWTSVGSPNFSTGEAYSTKIAIDSSGTPYVVYRDGWSSGNATVMKYESGNWIQVSSPGGGGDIDIAIDSSGTPYVVYGDDVSSGKATVMKYENGSLTPVGSPGFSVGRADYINIAIDSSGTPYVVYRDGVNSDKATVMKYENGSWEIVSSPDLSAGSADYTNIALDSSGVPYVVYGNIYYFNLTVMKLFTYGIDLSQTGNYNFNSQIEGYSQVAAKGITVTKTGNGDITNMAVNLTSGATNSFNVGTLSTTTLDATAGSTTFTIQPKDGLPAGNYTSTVTVTADNNISESFDVSFNVNPPIEIHDVNSIGDINVINGTNIDAIGLPASVNITLADSTTRSAAVTWDTGTPSYDGTTAGTYEFKGTLTLPNGVTNTTNKYATAKVVVAPAGAVISPAVNSVTVTPSIASLVKGGSVKLSANVNVTGILDKTVNWLSSDGSKVSVDNNGLVTVATDAALGDYTITAVSTADGTKSGASTITVIKEPVTPPTPPVNQTSPIIKKQPSNQAVRKGNTANFRIQVAGTEPLTYQWKKGDIYLSDGDSFSGTTTPSVKIKNVRKSDAGEYSCIVTDGNFNVTTSSAATLRVTSKSSNGSSSSDSSKVSDAVTIDITNDVATDEIAILNALNTKTTKVIIVNVNDLTEINRNPLISQSILAALKANIDSNQKKTLIIKTSNSSIEIKNKDGQIQFTENGAIISGFRSVGNENYYLDDNGIMQTGWIKAQDGSWYHFNDNSGTRDSGWFQDIDGAKYYLDQKTGIMKTGWINDNGALYYLKSNGAMATGWLQDVDGKWYYLNSNGVMARNTSIDGYYVDEYGVWNSVNN